MKKYLLLLLPLLAACTGAPEVEIEKKIEYKCGEQIISADFLDDDSMIARVDGSTMFWCGWPLPTDGDMKTPQPA